MSELSEKELLLLSNYMYLDKCTEYRTINEMLDSCRSENGWIDESRMDGLGYGGGMTRTECRKLLQEMDSASEDFKKLSVVRKIDEPELRAVCFEGPDNDGHVTVAFRGTGGTYKAWADNVRGGYMQDTDIQKMADDFIRYECGVYESVTVTGHSKGGNLAGYTTVTNRDRVRSCIAFDPQGYGVDFRKAYEAKVRDASYNIRIVCAHNDMVNPLLCQIAHEIVYVRNERNGPVGRHGSFALLEACEFDDEGNIINATAKREFLMDGLSGLTRCAQAAMNMLPNDGDERVSEFLASVAAGVLSEDASAEYRKEQIKESAASLAGYCLNTVGIDTESDPGVKLITESIYADTAGIKGTAAMMQKMHEELAGLKDRLTELRLNISYRAAGRLAVEIRLKALEGRLDEEVKKLGDLKTCLEGIAAMIESCESDITGKIAVARMGQELSCSKP